MTEASSYQRTRNRFDHSEAARKCSARHWDNRRLRERQCIMAALDGVPRGSRVLDLPCGAGFLIPSLVDAGYRVAACDVSRHMLGEAERMWEVACRGSQSRHTSVEFSLQDVVHTTFPDDCFDAAVCNRLLHHFMEPAMRRAALTELGRTCTGPIVVFYFDSFALDSLRLAALRLVFGKFCRDRRPISTRSLAADGAACGLYLDRTIPTRWGISPQTYAVFRRI